MECSLQVVESIYFKLKRYSAGAFVYAAYDIHYEKEGYAWISFNTFMFTLQVIIEKYAVTSVDQTAVGVSCYQNLLSLPVLIVGMTVAGTQLTAC